jgi:hypothetical protein
MDFNALKYIVRHWFSQKTGAMFNATANQKIHEGDFTSKQWDFTILMLFFTKTSGI